MGKSLGFRVSASERRGDTLKDFKDFYLEVKARIWPWLSNMLQVRSTADVPEEGRDVRVVHLWRSTCHAISGQGD